MIVEGTVVSKDPSHLVLKLRNAMLLSPAGCMQPPPSHLIDLEQYNLEATCAAPEQCDTPETSTAKLNTLTVDDNIRGAPVQILYCYHCDSICSRRMTPRIHAAVIIAVDPACTDLRAKSVSVSCRNQRVRSLFAAGAPELVWVSNLPRHSLSNLKCAGRGLSALQERASDARGQTAAGASVAITTRY